VSDFVSVLLSGWCPGVTTLSALSLVCPGKEICGNEVAEFGAEGMV
jgi:hypothetical protein